MLLAPDGQIDEYEDEDDDFELMKDWSMFKLLRWLFVCVICALAFIFLMVSRLAISKLHFPC